MCLRRSIARLPGRERRVFVLKDVEGFRHDEIGRLLGIPEATVRTLLHRAVLKLRKDLAAFIILWGAVLIWVYRDAEMRGMSGILWLLLVLIGNVIGLLIYAIVRSETPVRRKDQGAAAAPPAPPATCGGCGKPIGAGFEFCPYCGKAVKSVCPACGKPVESGWKVCPACGAPIDPGATRQG